MHLPSSGVGRREQGREASAAAGGVVIFISGHCEACIQVDVTTKKTYMFIFRLADQSLHLIHIITRTPPRLADRHSDGAA